MNEFTNVIECLAAVGALAELTKRIIAWFKTRKTPPEPPKKPGMFIY